MIQSLWALFWGHYIWWTMYTWLPHLQLLLFMFLLYFHWFGIAPYHFTENVPNHVGFISCIVKPFILYVLHIMGSLDNIQNLRYKLNQRQYYCSYIVYSLRALISCVNWSLAETFAAWKIFRRARAARLHLRGFIAEALTWRGEMLTDRLKCNQDDRRIRKKLLMTESCVSYCWPYINLEEICSFSSFLV